MSTRTLNLHSTIVDLNKGRSNKSIEKLALAEIKTIEDLLWILPLSVLELPSLNKFSEASIGQLFLGRGKVISCDARPGKSFGKRGIPLKNVTLTIQDIYSHQTMTLKWFNAYPSLVKKIESYSYLEFDGLVSQYQSQLQMVNPNVSELDQSLVSGGEKDLENNRDGRQYKVKYPTVNTIGSAQISKLIAKIPEEFWSQIPDSLQESIHKKRELLDLSQAFSILHGKFQGSEITPALLEAAKKRLIYEEFLREQLKISLRKQKDLIQTTNKIEVSDEELKSFTEIFPYQLTIDQEKALTDIRKDMARGKTMMRLIQGDVGCGKTSVALCSALMFLSKGYQVALMCPTESLALQHFLGITELLEKTPYKVGLLLGSTKKKEKELIKEQLQSGAIDFIIGTHSLIQDSVQFQKLGLSIIDEQHKFGVNQRLKLSNKAEESHTLIMTATPIPRSLSLTQYGDLDISVIKVMPSGRKGTQTRIVNPESFEKFLSFVKTRLSMGEQVYIVVPAIQENPEIDIVNLEQVLKKFEKLFPEYKVRGMHGQMKGEEKQQFFKDFSDHQFDMLISTSVIEVGINVINATVMAIMNPDRFGLSSLHQLRGRVGRGEKPGFCFLVNDKKLSPHSMKRLKVIEKNIDGFIISEEDLKNRGEGNLFGVEQSGTNQFRKIASIIDHPHILYEVKEDFSEIVSEKNPLYQSYLEYLSQDERIFSTI